MRISREEKENRREQIIEKGLDLVFQNGYNATGIQDIARAAEIPKGSFFNYFKNKEDFAVALLQKHLDNMREFNMPRLFNGEKDVATRLYDFFDSIIEIFRSNGFSRGCLMGNMGAELADTSPRIRRALAESWDALEAILRDVLRDAREKQELGTEADVDTLAAFILNSWEGAILRMKIQKNEKPLEDFKKVLRTLIAK